MRSSAAFCITTVGFPSIHPSSAHINDDTMKIANAVTVTLGDQFEATSNVATTVAMAASIRTHSMASPGRVEEKVR